MNEGLREYTCTTPRIVWGAGSVSALGDCVARAGASRVLLLAGRTVGASAWFADIRAQLGPACAAVHAEIEPHTPVESLRAAIHVAREGGIDAIAMAGGGAVMDAGKLVAVALAEGDDFDRMRVRWTEDRRLDIPVLRAPKVPLFAVPTTLAAAEVVGAAAYVEDGQRFVIVDAGILPRAVIYDAQIAATTPAPLFLGTGINAVAHCIEAYCSAKSQPFSDALSLGALEMLVSGLLRCGRDPSDLAARQDAQVAAGMSGVAYTGTWLGIAHSLCQALGARFRTPQGALHAVMLPHAVRYNLPVTFARQERLCRAIADGMGGQGGVGNDASAAIAAFTRALNLPQRLRDLDIPLDELDAAAEDAFSVWHTFFNPRPVASPGELREVLAAAW